jgi:carbon-monoxide dehydrogenase medium subunit
MSAIADNNVRYEVPDTVEETRALLTDSPAKTRIVAGGQSLMLLLRQGSIDPELLIDISNVPDYNMISVTDDQVTIGATTTYNQLKSHDVSSMYEFLEEAISVIADSQIRNLGTVGGALGYADPALDIVPPLLCLDATVQIGGPQGSRAVPLSEFCEGNRRTVLNEKEIIESITFQRPNQATSIYENHSKKEASWSTIGVGAMLRLSEDNSQIKDASIALAGVSNTHVRAPSVEKVLEESTISNDMIEQAAHSVRNDINPVDDPSASARYKKQLAQTLTQRAITSTVERSGGKL